jgi:3'(2'), 5'-bisphosphate nucleotidase
MSYEKEQTVAIQACLQAAKLCERIRSTIPDAIEKLDRSPVTVRHRKMIFAFFFLIIFV